MSGTVSSLTVVDHTNKTLLTTQENSMDGHDIYNENNSKVAYTTQVLKDTFNLYDNNGKHIGTVQNGTLTIVEK